MKETIEKMKYRRHSDYIKHRGIMLVLSSPSGAGKTTISHHLLEQEKHLSLSISVTTRSPRPGEVDGQDYFFKTPEEFKRMTEEGAFLEHAEVFGNHYGTPKDTVEEELQKGQDILFDIDWQGAQQLLQEAASDVVSVFILPPSLEVLEDRLKARAQDSEDVIHERMSKAMYEMSHWAEYDYVIINEDLDRAIADVQSIIRSERLKRCRQIHLTDFIHKMNEEAKELGI